LPQIGLLGFDRREPYRSAQTTAIAGLMQLRARKFVGTIALLLLVVTWSLLAMAFAQVALPSTSGIIATVYYVVAGLGWVLPALPLVTWMSRSGAPRPKNLR
jgi:hypothetical protein